jgi:hypothetical protein
MFAKLVWAAWGWSTAASFRVGMWFVRLSSYRLCRSYNSVDNGRWSIDHWSREEGRLNAADRVQYSEFVRSLLWFVAEPHMGAAGAVPWSQHALIVELLANRWSGGHAADLVALVAEVMAAEDLVVY